MIPILYDKTEKAFADNGFGRLSDCIECTVTEGAPNGPFELELEYPAVGIHAAELTAGAIVSAIPAEDRGRQPFRIDSINKTLDGTIRCKAKHISYDLLKRQVNTGNVPVKQTGAAAALQDVANRVIPRYAIDEFSFSTDIESTATWSVKDMPPGTVREILGGREGSILDTFGGEFEWDGYNVILHKMRGEDNGVVIEYGKNLTDMDGETDSSGAVSCVFPYYYKKDANIKITSGSVTWEAGNMLYLADQDDPVLEVPGATIEGCAGLDLTDEFDDPPTSFDALRNVALQKISKFSGTPADSVTAKFVPLWQTLEYADLNGQKVHIGDVVQIRYPGMSVNVRARVTKTVYNVLTEKYDSIEVGTSSDLFDTISDMIDSSGRAVPGMNNLLIETDTASWSSGTTNHDLVEITAPHDGAVVLSGRITIPTSTTSSRHAELTVEGTTVGAATIPGTANANTIVNVSGLAVVKENDSIKLRGWQRSGSNQNVSGELRAYFINS